jgi:hypothetical protein
MNLKRFIAILLGTIFVLGLAATVYATELKFGGDAFVEGVWRDGYDLNGTQNADDDYRWWGQRVRLKFDAIVENGIEVRTRLRVSDAVWNGATRTKCGDTSFTAVDNQTTEYNGAVTSQSTCNNVTTDYAYLHVPIGDATIDVGHMLASWGNGFWAWNAEVDRVVLQYKLGDTVTVGAYIKKDTELLQGDNEGDQDSYSLFVNVKPSDATKFGVITVYSQNQPNDTANRYDEASEATGADYEKQDGVQFDAYFNTKMGSVTLMSEAAYLTGHMFSTTNSNDGWNDQFGCFVAGVVDLSPVTLTLATAYANNLFNADNDFKPTYFFGVAENPLAIMDFQSIDEDRSTIAFVVGVDMKATDNLTVGGKMAYASFGVTGDVTDNTDGTTDSNQDGNGDYFEIVEFDLGMTYQIAKSTSYTIGMAYGIPTNVPEFMSQTDDQIVGMFHKLAISF